MEITSREKTFNALIEEERLDTQIIGSQENRSNDTDFEYFPMMIERAQERSIYEIVRSKVRKIVKFAITSVESTFCFLVLDHRPEVTRRNILKTVKI